ncbi:MAG TPA: S9 family peptidase [Bacteroidia bacterium]|jgi:dipeptidyl-peptidase-4|nr:S9 family peptidase [Bacteroidia bacterium]
MKKLSLLVMAFAFTAVTNAQKRNITLNDIWQQYKFAAKGIDELQSTADGDHYTALDETHSSQAIIKYSYATGKPTDTLLTTAQIVKANNNVGYVIQTYALGPNENSILLGTAGERIYRHSTIYKYSIWDKKKGTITPLMDGEKEVYATISPDGNMAAFVYKSNLYVKNLSDNKVTQVTHDGSNEVFNGISDWVYEEEYALTRSYFWSPDSKSIAYYRFDDSKVTTFSMNEYHDSLYPSVYSFKYPKAGTTNPTVTVHVYQVAGGKVVDIKAPGHYEYTPRVTWTKDPAVLSVQYMDRHQDSLILALANINTGTAKPILTEGNKTYIDINDALTFINNNKEFIWMDDNDGYDHLYRYSIDGKQLNAITVGKWDVIDIKGIDEKTGTIFYISSETSPIDRDLYSINWDGKNKKKLSSKTGFNDADFSTTFHYYINTFSTANTPGITTLNSSDGKEIRVLEDNKELSDTLSHYNLSKQTFFTFTTSQGNNLNGYIIKPPGFDSTKKYPVLMYVYGGPGSNTVNNEWNAFDGMWFQMLAEKGYIIVSIDNRGTQARGSEFKKCTYLHLGKYEVEDQIEGAKYMALKPYVDNTRIGIWGWSYGGYMAAMCIAKGARYFKTAISVAPVIDWSFYDSIYTERYMRTPQENGDGYKDGSPINFADEVKGHYMLIHGTGDDNVHFQNSIEWIHALQKANVPFSLMIFPDKNHSIAGGNTRFYLFNELTDFISTNL